MAFGTFVQKRAGSSLTDPIALAYSGAVTSGSFLVCAVYWHDTTHAETCTVADSVNGAWTAIGSPLTGAGALADYRMQMFFLATTGAGTPTVTASLSGTGDTGGIAILEYATGPAALDGTQFGYINRNLPGAPGLANTIDVTPSVTTALVVGAAIAGYQMIAAGTASGFTYRFVNDGDTGQKSWGGNGLGDLLPGNTTTRNCDFYDDDAGGDDVITGIAVFKASGPATVTGQVASPFTFGSVIDGQVGSPGPTNVTPPSVTGTAQVGETLTCDPGEWTI